MKDIISDNRKNLVILLSLLLPAALSIAGLSGSSLETKRKMRQINARRLCMTGLAGENTPISIKGFSSLFLNNDALNANEDMLSYLQGELGSAAKDADEKSVQDIEEDLDWWLRLYFEFHPDKNQGKHAQLSSTLAKELESVFFTYASVMSNSEEVQGELIWAVEGNKSKTIKRWIRTYLCIEAVRNEQKFKAAEFSDGKTIEYHYALWTEFLELFVLEHCKFGLFPEIFSSPDQASILISLFNLYDFTKDSDLKRKVDILITFILADWSHLHYNGVYAGARTGMNFESSDIYSQSDKWRYYTAPFVGSSNEWLETEKDVYANDFGIYVSATTNYQLPDVVLATALGKKPRKSFVSISAYPANIIEKQGREYLDKDGKKFLSYSYVTNYYCQSSVIASPEAVSGFEDDKKMNIASDAFENIMSGLTFQSSPGSIIYPVLRNGENEIREYNSLVSVQNKNITLYMPNRSRYPEGAVELIMSSGLSSNMRLSSGWKIFKTGGVWVGIKGFSPQDGQTTDEGRWANGNRLIFDKEKGPVAMVTGLSYKYKDFEAFSAYLEKQFASIEDGNLTFYGVNTDKEPAKIQADLQDSERPSVNGEKPSLQREYLYDCPLIRSKEGSGILFFSNESKSMVIDVVKDIISES
ncbi:hypothetical protein [Sedimentisphaera salicampi]|uniref:hypothetical protein n=1 Tax=Sedimentisphaera salicampi TaxID=1941349 RepID=UPI000B9BB838|nr:hypothetical protein [Sedimentisphaera salicampi]OXU16078.1 hypothetical protein SMSP1_00247 [Sedimentisphaera salicampi]